MKSTTKETGRPKGTKSLNRRPRDGRYEAATQRPDKKKNANCRTALQREKDLAFIARWRNYGYALDAIHQKLKAECEEGGRKPISRHQVYLDLKAVDKAWQEERQKHVETLRDKDLARLEADEFQLVEAWEASKKSLTKQKVKQSGNTADGTKTEKTFETVSNYGDPAIMGQILRIRELRAKICGYAAPQRIEHTGADGAPLPATVAAPIINVTIAPPPQAEAM
jgi:DNA-binding transcriptional MerR regulator